MTGGRAITGVVRCNDHQQGGQRAQVTGLVASCADLNAELKRFGIL
jgi:hypothetical protein